MDGLANPYFAMAAILGAGLQGVLDGEPIMIKNCKDDPALMDDNSRAHIGIKQMLPKDFQEAMQCLSQDVGMKKILGHTCVKTYLIVESGDGDAGCDDGGAARQLLERY
jgi:glutamine synthetase